MWLYVQFYYPYNSFYQNAVLIPSMTLVFNLPWSKAGSITCGFTFSAIVEASWRYGGGIVAILDWWTHLVDCSIYLGTSFNCTTWSMLLNCETQYNFQNSSLKLTRMAESTDKFTAEIEKKLMFCHLVPIMDPTVNIIWGSWREPQGKICFFLLKSRLHLYSFRKVPL